jgi:hypothetical protein
MNNPSHILQLGDRFPDIEVQTLEDKKLHLPADATGKWTLLATGFSMEAQNPINTWTEYVLTTHPEWNYFEVPIGNEWYAMISKSIDNAMKREVPKTLHSKTATYYGAKCRDYKRLFGVVDESTCYVFLLDDDGKIIFKTVGAITPASKETIEKLLL